MADFTDIVEVAGPDGTALTEGAFMSFDRSEISYLSDASVVLPLVEPAFVAVGHDVVSLSLAASGTAIVYQNRVYDSVAGKHVYWTSNNQADDTGSYYPGPGTFGVTTSNYVVSSVRGG